MPGIQFNYLPCTIISCWPGFDEDRLNVCDCLHGSILDDRLFGFHYFLVLYATPFCFWDVPGDVLAAPAPGLCGWKGVIRLSLQLTYT